MASTSESLTFEKSERLEKEHSQKWRGKNRVEMKVNYSKKEKEGKEIIVDCEYLCRFVFHLKFIGSGISRLQR